MSARDAEDMANAMLLDSPLPDIQRSDEKLPEEGGSGKLLCTQLSGRPRNNDLITRITGFIYIGTTHQKSSPSPL